MRATTPPTGSVLACYGTGWVSRVISLLTPRLRFWRAAPSHVAIVARHPDGRTYVWESTTLGKLRDKLAGEQRRGVQAHLYLDWLLAQPGTVDLYRLKTPPPREHELVAYLLGVHRRKVGYDVARALHSASPVVNSETGEALFCSELVGYALQKGGSIGSHVNCSELTPWDIIHLKSLAKPERVKGS